MTAAKTVHCTRCGRTLKTAKSISLGLGPVCARKANAALGNIADYTDQQIEKAAELIELGAIVRISPVEFEIVGSRGDHYRTTAGTCSCPAGEHGRRCYHCCAVMGIAA